MLGKPVTVKQVKQAIKLYGSWRGVIQHRTGHKMRITLTSVAQLNNRIPDIVTFYRIE